MEDIHKGDIGTRLDFAVALVKEEADAGLLLRVHRGHSCLHSIASDVQARTQTTSGEGARRTVDTQTDRTQR